MVKLMVKKNSKMSTLWCLGNAFYFDLAWNTCVLFYTRWKSPDCRMIFNVSFILYLIIIVLISISIKKNV